MKIVISLLAFASTIAVGGETKVVATSSDGRFEIEQKYMGEFAEVVRFRSNPPSTVELEGFPWPGIYSISPDGLWILRTQKVGSGESVAMLYHVEENRRISKVIGFDELPWGESDARARLKRVQLYHTGVAQSTWAADSKSIQITLSGSNSDKSGDGIETRITYDLTSNKVSPETK